MSLEVALSAVLCKRRKEAGFTQEELAYRSGIDRTYISMLERGKRKPTINVIFKICDALHIKPSDFIIEIEMIMWAKGDCQLT